MNRRISLFGFEMTALTISAAVEQIYAWVGTGAH